MDQFESLVRFNQLRAKSKELSMKWIILSSLTCLLLLIGSFSYNWLSSHISPLAYAFNRDQYAFGGYGSGLGLGMGSYGLGGLGGLGSYGMGGLGYGSMDHHGGGIGYGAYGGSHGMISTLGPFSGCFETRTRLDFFGFNCRMPTDNFLKLRNRASGTLIFCEFLLVLGTLLFTFTALGSCCGCFGKNRIIGLLQISAGVIYLFGVVLFFGNVGDPVSKMFCGPMAESFQLGYCSVGIGFFIAIIGNISMFICALIYLKGLRKPIRAMPTIDKV